MDREKVIKGLELCKIGFGDRCYETECPYYGQGCTESLKNDILELLKEQEAVEPIEVFKKDTNCHEYHCKRCGNKVGTILGGKHPILPGVKLSIEHFCDVCGQAVKWE